MRGVLHGYTSCPSLTLGRLCNGTRRLAVRTLCHRPAIAPRWPPSSHNQAGILDVKEYGMAKETVGQVVWAKREAILRLAAKHGATQVRLIGSVARGDDRPESDIDFLMTWAEGTSLLDQAALTIEMEELLGRKVEIASDGWLKPSIRESVYRDAVAL